MRVLGTKLFGKGFDQLLYESFQVLDGKPQNLLVSPSDANVLVTARMDRSFAEVLHRYYWNLPDGVPSVWVLKLKGVKQATRCSGPDYFKAMIELTANKQTNHFLCGGAPGVAEELKQSCENWGNKNVVGTLCPPFRPLSDQEIEQFAKTINAKRTDIVWVGLGAPKQIYFAERLSRFTDVKMIVTIGAAFDFHTGRVKKAPRFIQKIGLEWFYRLIKEPQRLAKRYFKVVPLFIIFNLIDVMKGGFTSRE